MAIIITFRSGAKKRRYAFTAETRHSTNTHTAFTRETSAAWSIWYVIARLCILGECLADCARDDQLGSAGPLARDSRLDADMKCLTLFLLQFDLMDGEHPGPPFAPKLLPPSRTRVRAHMGFTRQ